jgi:hypothetical protein
MEKLLLKKLLLAFVLGFAPPFLYGIIGVLDSIGEGDWDYSVLPSLFIGIISGALSAGIRFAIAELTDWMPTDNLHGIGDSPESVTVTRDS